MDTALPQTPPSPADIQAQSAPALAAYNTAQNTANTSQEADQTLPAMLMASFVGHVANNNNPLFADQNNEANNAVSTLQNAGTDTNNQQVTLPNGVTVPLGGGAQLNAQQDQEKTAASPLNATNLMLAFENQGILNKTSMLAALHAQDTQKLLDQASLAQKNYEDVLNSLSLSANAAVNYDNAHTAAANAETSRMQLVNSPDYMKQQTTQALNDAAKSGESLDQLLKTYGSNPNISKQDIVNAWSAAHPGEETPLSSAQRQQYGVSGNQPGLEVGAQNLLHLLGFQ
jgi:hypothetical protein